MSLKRISYELKFLQGELPEFVEKIIIDPEDIKNLDFIIKGPKDSPYEGGRFDVSMIMPINYPFSSPNVRLKTKIYHPNFSFEGKLCKGCSFFISNWNPSLRIRHVLDNIYECIEQLNTPCSFNFYYYSSYHEDKQLFLRIARDFTLRG